MGAGRQLPGDGFEEAEADEKANGGGEEDGPGVGGEAEGWAGAWSGHVGLLGENALGTRWTCARAAEFLEEGYGAGGTSYNNNV
jgi:hypothetical protein